MQVLNFRQLPVVRHTRSCRLRGPAPGRRSLVLAQASAVDAVAGAVKEAADGIKKTVSGNGRPPQTGEVKPFPGRDKEGDIHHPREQTILLQGFGWSSCEVGNWWGVVKENIPRIKAAGFTHCWLPPPSQSVAPQGYLPGQLYNLDSHYGNQEGLKELVAALKAEGIVPVADIVINHRCADEKDEHTGVYNRFRDDINHKGEKIDWGQWAITGDDPDFGGQGSADTGDDYGPAPDLDHANDRLRSSLVDWMNWLKTDIGFEAWRFDFVKAGGSLHIASMHPGYAPRFMGQYCGDTVGNEKFNVGEYWVDLRWGDNGLEYDQNAPRQALVDWLDQASGCTLFDFVTKGVLQEAVKNCEYWRLIDPEGKAPGLLGWWPSRAVTFITNHDTDSTQQHWPFPHGKWETGYAYIMTHPGMPTVMWEDIFDNGLEQKITELIDVRKRNGIQSRSKLDIKLAEHDLYVAVIDDKLTLKLGPRHDMPDYLVPKDGWKVASAGSDYCIWERC